MDSSITLKNRRYKIREIALPEMGIMNIGSTSLANKLMTEAGGYVSEEHASLDEVIFFFVGPKAMKLTDEKLA